MELNRRNFMRILTSSAFYYIMPFNFKKKPSIVVDDYYKILFKRYLIQQEFTREQLIKFYYEPLLRKIIKKISEDSIDYGNTKFEFNWGMRISPDRQ